MLAFSLRASGLDPLAGRCDLERSYSLAFGAGFGALLGASLTAARGMRRWAR